MKTSHFLISAIGAFLLPFFAFAQAPAQLVDVVATGHGETVREATKAALRAAVEQVVGTMVDATTLVENDELIEDEILSYSAGMIEKATTIGEPKKSEGGFYTVKVKATVKKGKLEEKLRAASAVNVTLDGADLFARMTAAQDNLADAENMIQNILARHIDCIVAEAVPGQNGTSPLDLDPKTGEVFANVRVRIDMAKYLQFAKMVVEKFGAMAEKDVPFEGKQSQWGIKFKPFNKDIGAQDILVVIDNLRGLHAHAMSFEKNRFDAICKEFSASQLAVNAILKDSFSDILSTTSMSLPNQNLALLGQCKNRGIACIIAPFVGGRIDPDGELAKNECWMDRTFRVSLGTFTAEELKNAGKLEIKVGHMKDGQFTE